MNIRFNADDIENVYRGVCDDELRLVVKGGGEIVIVGDNRQFKRLVDRLCKHLNYHPAAERNPK